MAEGMAVGLIQPLPVTTDPGANHVFAPPLHWVGQETDYRKLMRQRWDQNPGARQQIYLTARALAHCPDPEQFVEGPLARIALQILHYIHSSGVAVGESKGK